MKTSYDELIESRILSAFEDDSYYYVRLQVENQYDNTMYKVDKQTKAVESILITSFFGLKTRRINPSLLKNSTLRHHQRKGAHWGVMNGPPYPLDRRKFGNPSSPLPKTSKSPRKSEKQKQGSLALGAVVVGSLAAGGAYVAAQKVKDLYWHHINQKGIRDARKKVKRVLQNIDNPVRDGFHTLDKPETVDEAMKNTNPWMNTDGGKQNCTSCAIASYLRTKGYDVVATPRGDGRYGYELYQKCIKNFDEVSFQASQRRFGKTQESAANFILKKFKGEDCFGAISITWDERIGGSHMFNFEIKDGKCQFLDFQPGVKNDYPKWYFGYSTDMALPQVVVRLDKAEFDFKKLKKLKVVE